MVKSLFEHDCDSCDYLGPFGQEGDAVDLWIHVRDADEIGNPGLHDLIIRRSDEGSDYHCCDPETLKYRIASGCENDKRWHGNNDEYVEVLNRATKRGLI